MQTKDALTMAISYIKGDKAWVHLQDEVLAACEEALQSQEPKCSEHPDAPHGFCRDASHSADRYVCECESWEEPKQTVTITRDEIYYAWRKHWAYGIPSKQGEAVFNANGDGFQAGWLACEEWINKEKNHGL